MCLPAFSDNVNQQVTEKEGERKEEPTSEPLDKQSQPPVEINEDSVSLTSLSSLSSNLPEEEEEATIALQQSTPNTQNYTEREDSATLNESVEVLVDLLHSGPLVRGDLPRNIDSLRDLRLHTEMELMWLRQAIASRRKVREYTVYQKLLHKHFFAVLASD